jgi:bifunctional UDP-N-acetylglucosamine pyrophosphorylase/glucosamine-1-phosphate N-acetyltransferase
VVEQAERLGTGHAVRCAAPALEGFAGDVLVLYADTPLLRAETVARLRATLAAGHGAAVGVLGFEPADPGGYGRLILDGRAGSPASSRRRTRRPRNGRCACAIPA